MFGTSHHPVQVRSVRIAFVALAAAVFALGLMGSQPAPAGAQATPQRHVYTSLPYYPDGLVVENPCAGGEPVRFSGSMHFSIQITFDPAGGVHARGHINVSGVRGVGLVTGTPYQLVGQYIVSLNRSAGSSGLVFDEVAMAAMIGQGPNNNVLLSLRSRLTINANDVVTVDHFEMEASQVCR